MAIPGDQEKLQNPGRILLKPGWLASIRMKKLMMRMKMIIIIISVMNKSQGLTVFHWRQKLTSAMKQRPEK